MQVLPRPGDLERRMHAKVSAPLNGPSRIDLIPGVIITGIRIGGSYGKESDPIRQTIFPFLFSTLINNFFTVSISSALLDATNNVKLANASLLMME